MKFKRISILYIIFLAVLFFPAKYLDIYSIIITILVCLSFLFYSFSIPINNAIIIFLVFYISLIISGSIGIFFYGTDPVRNTTELVRFLPILLLLGSFREVSYSLVHRVISNTFAIYSTVCLIVSLLQINNVPFIETITNIYSSPLHIEYSLGLSSRALGLSGGPGQNGLIMVIIFSYSVAQSLISKNKAKHLITLAMSFTVIILSQSQTAFLTSLIVSIYAIMFSIFILKKKSRIIALRYTILLVPLFSLIVYLNRENFRYLFTIFTLGLERNSYQARIRKTDDILDLINDNPFTLIFGHGKDYFGSISSHMDNEYIFYLGVYGLLPTLLIIFFYLYIISYPYIKHNYKNINNKSIFTLHLIIISGVIMAWPSAFLLDPRVLFIVTFIYLIEFNSLSKKNMYSNL